MTLGLRVRYGYGARLLDWSLRSGRNGTWHYMLGMRLMMGGDWMRRWIRGWGLVMRQARVTH